MSGKIKLRPIDNPSEELKAVQRKILSNLLGNIAIPDYLHGAAKGRTIKTNAAAHLGARVVVKMDIKGFFQNVTNNHVYRIWKETLKCSPPVAKLLTRLTTYRRHLPQGAPTSSALANIYLGDVLPQIIRRCEKEVVSPSAYVDDIMFSGDNARAMMEPTREMLAMDGFSFPCKKRKVMGPRSSKVSTGVRLGRYRIRATKEKLSDIRAGIHKIALGIQLPGGRKKYLTSIEAKIRHIESLCEDDGRKLRLQLRTALIGRVAHV
jgi:RNA-directed DNA polymerase